MTEGLTDDERERIGRLLTDLIVLQRDRLLGFPKSELHKPPEAVLENADVALEALGKNPERVLPPEDRRAIGLDAYEGGE